MRETITYLWARHRLLTIAFSAALLLTLFFVVRTIAFYAYWSANRDLPIESWMPVGYIARSYGLPPQALQEALGIERGDRRTLAQIARERGVPISSLMEEVDAAIAAAKAATEAETRP